MFLVVGRPGCSGFGNKKEAFGKRFREFLIYEQVLSNRLYYEANIREPKMQAPLREKEKKLVAFVIRD